MPVTAAAPVAAAPIAAAPVAAAASKAPSSFWDVLALVGKWRVYIVVTIMSIFAIIFILMGMNIGEGEPVIMGATTLLVCGLMLFLTRYRLFNQFEGVVTGVDVGLLLL